MKTIDLWSVQLVDAANFKYIEEPLAYMQQIRSEYFPQWTQKQLDLDFR